MKLRSKLAIATILLATAVTAFPRHAAASTTSTDVTATSAVKGGSTDDKHKDWSEVIETVVSVLGLLA